jgi:hypothetical protein
MVEDRKALEPTESLAEAERLFIENFDARDITDTTCTLNIGGQMSQLTLAHAGAITGFVRLERATYAQQIAEALKVLRAAKDEFAKQGYEVETIRIVTQPLGELVSGLPETKALAFLKALDDLSEKENFMPSVGPGMMRDTDDPATMRLLEKALSTLPHIQANAIIAGEDGIHWKVIHESAALVRYVSDHSPHSQGNF